MTTAGVDMPCKRACAIGLAIVAVWGCSPEARRQSPADSGMARQASDSVQEPTPPRSGVTASADALPAKGRTANGLKIADTLVNHMDFTIQLCAGDAMVANLSAQNAMRRGESVELDTVVTRAFSCADSAIKAGDVLFRRVRDAGVATKTMDAIKDVYADWKTSMKDLQASGVEFTTPGQGPYQHRLKDIQAEVGRRLERLKLDLL